MKSIAWTYRFFDNCMLLLLEGEDDFILEEHDAKGRLVSYSYRKDNKIITFKKVHYSKRGYTLDKVIKDIKEDYGL